MIPSSICTACGKVNAPLVCSNCKVSGYCNKECQRASWPSHKLKCKDVATIADRWRKFMANTGNNLITAYFIYLFAVVRSEGTCSATVVVDGDKTEITMSSDEGKSKSPINTIIILLQLGLATYVSAMSHDNVKKGWDINPIGIDSEEVERIMGARFTMTGDSVTGISVLRREG